MSCKDVLFIFFVFFVVGMAVLAYILTPEEGTTEATKVSYDLELAKFNDGICDDELNVGKFNYDNGDCCGDDSSSRLLCETCLCNATIMTLLRELQGFNEDCSLIHTIKTKNETAPRISPYDGVCNFGIVENIFWFVCKACH